MKQRADIAQQVERILGKDPLYATSQQLYTEHADIAQQVERILGKDEVPGSNPGISSRLSPSREHRGGDFLCVFKGFRVFTPFLPAD